MDTRKYLYSLLVSSVLIQVTATKYFACFPDLIIAAVVFTGIFYGLGRGFELGLAAGILRGIFSAETISVDVLILPAVGMISALLARMVYRHNPFVQLVITFVAVFMTVLFHTVYLNLIYGNDLNYLSVFAKSWRPIAATVFFSPFLFAFLKRSLKVES